MIQQIGIKKIRCALFTVCLLLKCQVATFLQYYNEDKNQKVHTHRHREKQNTKR